MTNDPEAGKHRDGDGDQKKKKKTEAAGIDNFGDKKAQPFGKEKKDEKKDKDCLDGGAMSKKDDKKEDKKEEQDKEEKKELTPQLAERSGSYLVTRVGNVVVLYRPKPEAAAPGASGD